MSTRYKSYKQYIPSANCINKGDILEPNVRIELTTCGLQNRCSTTELIRHNFTHQSTKQMRNCQEEIPHESGPVICGLA